MCVCFITVLPYRLMLNDDISSRQLGFYCDNLYGGAAATIRVISRKKGIGGRWIGRLRSSLRASLRRNRTLQVVKASFVFASCYGDNSRL